MKYIPGEKSLKIIKYTEKKAKHKPSGYSLVTCCSFDKFKNERKYYREKDCIEMFSKDLKDKAMKIINYENKKIIHLTNEEKEVQKISYICEEEFCIDKNNEKEFKAKQKVRDHCHYTGKYIGAAHSLCNLRYKIPKEIAIVFHNGSTYDYHFIIKQLAKDFKGSFDCFGENTEKYITFYVPIKKEHDNDKTVICKLKFIDNYRVMSDSLSRLIDNLSEINEKEPENEFIDSMRSMSASLSSLIDDVSKINKKEPENEFIDSMRSWLHG